MRRTVRRRSSRFAAVMALAVGAVVLISGCSSGSSGGASSPAASDGGTSEPFTMSVGTLPFASLAAFHIADDEGLFKDAGLTVESHQADSGAAQVAAMMAGDIDVTYSNFVSALQGAQQGLPIQIFLVNDLGNTGTHLSSGLMVKSDSPIQNPADFKGKKIAINALGATQEMTTRRIMEDAGLGDGDYELVEIPPANMLAALDSSQVDAAWIADPFLTVGIENNGLRQVSPAFYGRTASVPQSGWITTKQFAEEHPEQLAAFTKVMQGVLAEEAADPTQKKVKEAIPTYTDITPEVASKLQIVDFDPNNNLDAISTYYDEMIRYNILAGPVDLNTVLLKQ